MKIKFLGAAKGVTGSCFLVEIGDSKMLIDCGMYQEKTLNERNYMPFEFVPSEIDHLFLTHAHLDHCGLIPKLVKDGFKGKIYCSFQTLELAKVILFDAAKIQEINQRMNNNGIRNELLYSSSDVEYALTKFSPIKLMDEVNLDGNISVKFLPVGHILGAASVFIKSKEKNILFSGDIGRTNQSIIKSFNDYSYTDIKPDYIVMESLYGGRIHEPKDENINILIESINKIKKNKGKILMPVFSMHRAQEILEIFNYLIISKSLESDFEIYLDSPMAIEICRIYLNNINEFNNHAEYLGNKVNYVFNGDVRKGEISIRQEDRFIPGNLKTILKQKKSKKLINATNAVIMAGSGMADGGRIVKHLYNGLERPENIVLLVGFQAEETLGRRLGDGEKNVTISDKEIIVRAEIKYLRGFSAHADENDLMVWLNMFDISQLENVFLVHAEEEGSVNFGNKLLKSNIKSYTPSYCEVVEV